MVALSIGACTGLVVLYALSSLLSICHRTCRLGTRCTGVLAAGAAVLLLAGGFAPSVHAQTVYYVTESGTGDGSSWSNATSLSDALSSATGNDAIVIAGGRYLPTDDATNRSARFTIDGSQDGLAVYGGWTGTETFTGIADVESQLDSRDLDANPTVLSGDIDNNDATNSDGITETASAISGGNSNTVLYLDGSTGGTITSSTVVDGVTLTGGKESGTADLPDPARSGTGREQETNAARRFETSTL